jgi:predicted GIY-YIG superfamily endonuclease
MYLYILELNQGKWYVGTTQNIKTRYTQHCNGKGAAFTKKYPPIKIFSYNIVPENTARLREDFEVKRLMGEHGIENVRGGSYSSIRLSEDSINALSRELNHAMDLCLECGSSEHWVNDCPDLVFCPRCGRNTHTSEQCYAKRDINGQVLDDLDSDDDCIIC